MSAYLEHLLHTNAIQAVLTRKNILAPNGDTLFSENTPMSQELVDKLHKLGLDQEPESLFKLQDEFTADTIYCLINEFIARDASFEEIYKLRDLDEKIIKSVEAFSEFSILRQRLNVLAISLPDVFEQSLFCAWLSITVLAHNNYPQHELDNAFIASLSHDLGLLDIPPHIMHKKTSLSSQEWEMLQQHPYHSVSLLEHLRSIDPSVIDAVLEHHEMIDGTGYPRGRYEKQLCELGRLINTLDSVNAIYRKHFRHRGRTLHDLVPTLQMTTLSRGGQFIETVSRLFKKSSKTEHCSLEQELIQPIIKLVKESAHEIKDFVTATSDFSQSVGTKHRDLKVLNIQNIARLIKTTLTDCGIINDAYMRWLEQVEKEKLEFAYRELEDVLLMIEEIKFHITRYERQIGIYVSKPDSNPDLRNLLSSHYEVLKHISKHQISQPLQKYLSGNA